MKSHRLTCGDCQALDKFEPGHRWGTCANSKGRYYMQDVTEDRAACRYLIPMDQKPLEAFKERRRRLEKEALKDEVKRTS